jgi:hypothetical protein
MQQVVRQARGKQAERWMLGFAQQTGRGGLSVCADWLPPAWVTAAAPSRRHAAGFGQQFEGEAARQLARQMSEQVECPRSLNGP